MTHRLTTDRLPRAARPWLILGTLIAALSGCASLRPDPTPSADIAPPPAWTAAPAAASASPEDLASWWTRFNDPDLAALVEQALKANTSVNSARAALAQARAQRDVQAAQQGPTLGATASARRSKAGSQDAGNSFQAGFDAGWEPDVFGGNRSATAASEADARAAASNLGNVQVSLAAEVAVNLIELRGLQARLAIARSNLAAQTETLQITRWRAQAGLAASLDVEQAVAASEQTAAQLPALQSGIGQALNALAVLTGELPGTLSSRLGVAMPIPQAPAGLALAFPADTLRQRPDVHTAEQRVVAALARVAVADADRYPSFRLNGSLGLSALTLSGLTGGASVVNSLVASVSAPLFDGGAAVAQVRAQQASAEQARQAYRAAVLAALQEVEDTLLALQGNRERVTRLETASAAAANADLLARQRFASGLIDFTTVLSTQRTLLSTQDTLASAQASLSADHVRLYKALGGGWQPAGPPDAR